MPRIRMQGEAPPLAADDPRPVLVGVNLEILATLANHAPSTRRCRPRSLALQARARCGAGQDIVSQPSGNHQRPRADACGMVP
jgi:hypothetical protein